MLNNRWNYMVDARCIVPLEGMFFERMIPAIKIC